MVDNYIGKAETGKRSRAVSREIKPGLKTLHAEGKGGPITRKGGGK
jgi:hypothetical protein